MELLALVLVCLFLAALILPWVNLYRMGNVKREVQALRAELRSLQMKRSDVKEATPSQASPPVHSAVVPPPIPKVERASAPLVSEPISSSVVAVKRREVPVAEVETKAPQDWFSKIVVWVGGIALLMAGFYMVKYSIESGWLTPKVRVWMTTGFGGLLCVSGFWISVRSTQLANARIGQVLSGAGIACLYFAAYAAVHLYGFFGSGGGFVAMVLVTLLAVALSLKHGAPIALLGLVGGFITPWLMQTDAADTAMLFSYVFLLFCGAQFLCVRRGWWGLLLGSLIGAYVWSAFVILSSVQAAVLHLEGSLLFVLGICCVNAIWAITSKPKQLSERAGLLLAAIRMLAWGGGLLQSLVLVWLGGFAGGDMALFAILSIGALTLAVLREEVFIWASWMALAAVTVVTLGNAAVEALSWLAWPLGLMALFFVVGHWRGLRSESFLVWRGLSVAAAVLLAPLLFVNREWILQLSAPFEGFWLLLSGACAVCLLLAGEHLCRRKESLQVVGEYSAFAVFLLGFGLWSAVAGDFLAHCLSGLMIVSVLYWRWRGLGRLRLVVGALFAAWLVGMLPLAGEAQAYFVREVFWRASDQDGVAVLAWLCGVSALLLTAYVVPADWPKRSRTMLGWALGGTVLFALVASYQWLDQSMFPESWERVLVEGGLTSLLALLAVAARAWVVRVEGLRWGSFVLSGLVLLRLVILHLGDSGAAGESFFWNALLLQFGLPFVAACALAWMCGEHADEVPRRVYQLAAMLLGFVWSTFLVQDYFGDSRLFSFHTSNTELYTYSVVWLLLAVLYQVIGLWRHQAAIHAGSLVLLVVTVGKVFLVDASELEGIFRVLSFLGLGVALIGIGFFYNKVVFARQRAE